MREFETERKVRVVKQGPVERNLPWQLEENNKGEVQQVGGNQGEEMGANAIST